MNGNNELFLEQMQDSGVITDIDAFVAAMEQHKLVLDKQRVCAIGENGNYSLLSVDDSSLFVCSHCSKWATTLYMGCCDELCYQCSTGDNGWEKCPNRDVILREFEDRIANEVSDNGCTIIWDQEFPYGDPDTWMHEHMNNSIYNVEMVDLYVDPRSSDVNNNPAFLHIGLDDLSASKAVDECLASIYDEMTIAYVIYKRLDPQKPRPKPCMLAPNQTYVHIGICIETANFMVAFKDHKRIGGEYKVFQSNQCPFPIIGSKRSDMGKIYKEATELWTETKLVDSLYHIRTDIVTFALPIKS